MQNKITVKISRLGFSLVEMLMALLVASLLLAALAPVMTRKFNDSVNVSGTPSGNNGSITPCKPDNNGECAAPMDAVSVSAIILSAGGGGGAAVAERISSTQTTLGSITGNDNQNANTYNSASYTLTEGMKDVEIVLISGGAGGGGGNGTAVAFTKQADCEPFGVWIRPSYNGGKAICVSKYNPGDFQYPPSSSNKYASPAIPSSVKVYNTDGSQGSGQCAGANCCWKPSSASYYSANSSYCDATGKNGLGNYSGCRRTVCQWNAADTICKNWKPLGNTAGRLPAYEELTAWKNSGLVSDKNSKPGTMNWDSSVGTGLQLCNSTLDASTGTARCYARTNMCKGASENYTYWTNHCYPYDMWSSAPASNSRYYHLNLNSGSAHFPGGCTDGLGCPSTLAFSVRCVLDESIVPYTGGGGGAGIYAKVNIPDEVLEHATSATGSANLIVQAGNGGKGGNGKSTARGTSGSASIAKITDSNGKILWYLEIPGGTGGAGASTTAGGVLGAAGNITNCKYMDITNPDYTTQKTVPCTSLPLANVSQGEAGGTGGAGNSYSSVGYGGRPKIENTLQGSRPQVPSGGSATTINGGNAGSAGGGGAGGNCYLNTGVGIVCGAGGYGKGGKVEIKYKKYTPGAAGGGGGAGGLLYIKNIPVKSGDIVKVNAGKGGNGGTSLGIAGNSGGSSFVTIAGIKFEVLGGGGGNAATAGNPDTGVKAIAGDAGTASNLTNATKSLINGLNENSYSIYPEDLNTTKGNGGTSLGIAGNNRLWIKSTGGDGGINKELSNGPIYPCGGLSTTENVCFKDTITPDILSTNLGYAPPAEFEERLLNEFPAGGTGGGGGGWQYGLGGSTGAKGLNGYVYVFFNTVQ